MQNTRRFCYICGTVTRELREGLCKSCFSSEKQELKIPKKMEVLVCRECSQYFIGQWKNAKAPNARSPEALAKQALKRHLGKGTGSLKTVIRVLGQRPKGKGLTAELEVTASSDAHDTGGGSKLHASLDVKEVLCPICSKKAGGYYEATIQLRSDSIKKIAEEARKVLNQLAKKDRLAFIVEETQQAGGMDLKIGSAKAAKTLGSHFKSRYKAKVKETATLVGRKEGRNIYRKTVLIRI